MMTIENAFPSEEDVLTLGLGVEGIEGKEIQGKDLITVRKILNDIPIELDEEGKIVCEQTKKGGRKRCTIHMTLNCPVKSHRHFSWKDSDTVILSPYEDMVHENGKPVNMAWQDTFWLGKTTYPKKSVVITGDKNVYEKLSGGLNEVTYVPELKDIQLEEKDKRFKEICCQKINELGYGVVDHDSLGGAEKDENEQLKKFSEKEGVNFGLGARNWTEKLDEYENIDILASPKRAILETARNRFSYKKGVFKKEVKPLLLERGSHQGDENLMAEVREKVLSQFDKIKMIQREQYDMPLHIFEQLAESLDGGEAEEILELETLGRNDYMKGEDTSYPKLTKEEREILKDQEIILPY